MPNNFVHPVLSWLNVHITILIEIVLSLIILSKFEWISHFLAWNLDFPPNYWVGKWDLRGIFPHEAKPSVEISPESPIFQRNNGGKSRLKAGIGKELKFWQNNQGDCFFWFLPYFRNPVPKAILKPFKTVFRSKISHLLGFYCGLKFLEKIRKVGLRELFIRLLPILKNLNKYILTPYLSY